VNRNELVDAVSNKTDMKKSEASKAVDAVFDAIADALKGGDEVRLVGFGTFSVASRAASEGRNPRTGEKIQIPASKLPKFRAGKGLKDAVQ
jgi:DNA-binding protein HU-beta